MSRKRATMSDEKTDKSSKKEATRDSESNSDSNLDEEEYVVEKIIKMRTTKKGKVQCKTIHFWLLWWTCVIFFVEDLLKWKGFPHSENTWVKPTRRCLQFFFNRLHF